MQLVADPRIVRRVLKARGVGRLGLDVPHDHCCVVEKAPLLAVATESELGVPAKELPDRVVLVSRPEGDDRRLEWRRAFHGRVHHELEAKALSEARIRERINRVGQTEFDEIRSVLRAEDLLFGRDDAETYVELVAFYLELYYFDRESIDEYFPALGDVERLAALCNEDVDGPALLEASRPEGAPDLEPTKSEVESAGPSLRPLAHRPGARVDASAAQAKKRGNDVRSMLTRLVAGDSADDDVASLAKRLVAALVVEGVTYENAPTVEAWSRVVRGLAEAAARESSLRVLPARVLFDMQKACVDAERGRSAVDLVTWATSLGRRPLVRPLPAVRTVRVARRLHHAFETSHRVRLSKAVRTQLEETFHAALVCAGANLRRVVKTALEETLDEVGLRPKSVPERVAREKLCEEIVDQVRERGTFGLGLLRDALSRSHLKLPNLTLRALVSGDALLLADKRLAVRLDGVYRSGEIYLRGLQKVSSVAFGTRAGRIVMLHVVLPLLVSFVALEGVSHLVHPIAKALHYRHVHLFTPTSFLVVALFVYGVIHSLAVRRAALGVLRAIGAVLHGIFVDLPRAILRTSVVRFLFRSRVLSLVTKPLLFGTPAYLVARRAGMDPAHALWVGGGLFLVLAVFLGTPIGARIEEMLTDFVVRRVRDLSRQLLPSLFGFIVDVFRSFVEQTERVIYTVDEWLTFKDGQSQAVLFVKGGLGVVWFLVTYLIRIYVNLLIEPQVNPIKHFPVVTVSHKIILPLSPTILGAMRTPLAPLGVVAANFIAGSTVFLLPGVFGFLVWELKENWKLYDQNRAKTLEPVRIGHHGETMRALLVVGFHSGTLPKLFAKLRDAMKAGGRDAKGASSAQLAKVNASRAKIHEVEHAIAMFVERELVGLLRQAKRWTSGDLDVRAVEVGSNRVRVIVGCGHCREDAAAIVHFEEQSGWLVASLARRGFVDDLAPDQRAMFELAIAGLYQRAGVDIVRQQVEALLGPSMPYDVADEGLVVWPHESYRSEVVYELGGEGVVEGRARGDALAKPPPALDLSKAMFSRQQMEWDAWAKAFEPSDAFTSRDSLRERGPSLLG